MCIIRLRCVIILILLAGCANQHIIDAKDITIPSVYVQHNIPVYFDGVDYDSKLHNKIALMIDELPQVHGHLNAVYVVDWISGGRYNWFTRNICIGKDDTPDWRRVFWHELGHVLQSTNLTCEQTQEWKHLAKIRLNAIGLDDFTGSDWKSVEDKGPFPTRYSTSNVYEYMADCFAKFKITKNYGTKYPMEYALIIKCGWG